MPDKEVIKTIYERRQARIEHPSGRTDNGGRWYPSDDEHCDCCNMVRQPSRAYPWSLMVHCRTKKHIKNLVEKWEK